MAEPILVMGASGVGKSTSLRNLNPDETFIIKPNAKSLPFPGANRYVDKKNTINTGDLQALSEYIKNIAEKAPHIKTIVIEDFTHFFHQRIFSPAFSSRTKGNEAFQRWNDFAEDVYNAFLAKAHSYRSDLFIVVIHHTEIKEDGTIGFKSSGKLLDNNIDVPSYFTYTFHALTRTENEKTAYRFLTNCEQGMLAKTPYGLFDTYIPNDLNAVLERIKAYQNGEVKIEFNN